MAYRHANKSCLNCGGDTSVPATEYHPNGMVGEVVCPSCGRILMRVVTVENATTTLPPPVSDRLDRIGLMLDAMRIGYEDQITTAEVWFSDHDAEVFMNGAPIRRSLPDAFYDFRDAVLSRHDIYG